MCYLEYNSLAFWEGLFQSECACHKLNVQGLWHRGPSDGIGKCCDKLSQGSSRESPVV